MTRKGRSKPAEDPIVRQVRGVRARLLRASGGTVEGYLETMRTMSERREKAAPKPKRRRRAA